MFEAQSGKMVVFDHDLVKEPKAMIAATTAGYGVFFKNAPAGSCFSGVQ